MKDDSVVSFSVRNDVLEKIVEQDREAATQSPLFDRGTNLLEKMTLLARAYERRGRAPVARSGPADCKSVEALQTLIQRPLNRIERAEQFMSKFLL